MHMLVYALFFSFLTEGLANLTSDRLLKIPILSTLRLNQNPHHDQYSYLQDRTFDVSKLPNSQTRNQILKIVTTVTAGDNQTFTQVLVDTGSSVLWVGGQQPYKPGPQTHNINETFSVGYGIGSARGIAYGDAVQIGSTIATSQIIGAANETVGFDLNRPFDGILGLGPSKSNAGEVSGFNTTPTFVETLFAEGKILQPVFGLYMQSLDDAGTAVGSGEITFGGPDVSRINGDITWIPQNPPLNLRWDFNISGMTFGTVASNGTSYGRTDSGVLGLEIPTEQFFSIIQSYNGTLDTTPGFKGFLSFPLDSGSSLPSLTITLNNTIFTISPLQYLIPSSIYPRLNMTADVLHTWICPAGPNAFNLGQKFLEKVYTVYDMANYRVGFAHILE